MINTKNLRQRRNAGEFDQNISTGTYQPDSPPSNNLINGAILGIFVCIIVLVFGFLMGSCAHAQDLKASWYSVESLKREGTFKYSHGIMANGRRFKDEEKTCATRLWPLGTIVRVTHIKTKKSVIVKVTDRIGKRFAKTRIDLSKSAFQEIAILKEGLINVTVERIL